MARPDHPKSTLFEQVGQLTAARTNVDGGSAPEVTKTRLAQLRVSRGVGNRNVPEPILYRAGIDAVNFLVLCVSATQKPPLTRFPPSRCRTSSNQSNAPALTPSSRAARRSPNPEGGAFCSPRRALVSRCCHGPVGTMIPRGHSQQNWAATPGPATPGGALFVSATPRAVPTLAAGGIR